jgi:hypothetical protein
VFHELEVVVVALRETLLLFKVELEVEAMVVAIVLLVKMAQLILVEELVVQVVQILQMEGLVVLELLFFGIRIQYQSQLELG